MLPRSRLLISLLLLALMAPGWLAAQNTAPVPTTFKIVTPDDGNAASLLSHNWSTNRKVFYGGDFFLNNAAEPLGFRGYPDGGNPVADVIARGNPKNSRLTLGGTEYGTDPDFPNSGGSYVTNLPGSRNIATSYDPDDIGGAAVAPDYGGMNGFIAINEGDALEIQLTGFIDPNNKMRKIDAASDGDFTGGNLESQYDPNGTPGHDGDNKATFTVDPASLPPGASFNNGRLRWTPNFLQGDGATDDSKRNGNWFIDANISNGSTTSELGAGAEVEDVSVGRGRGELHDSLYVIYFKAIDDSGQPSNMAIDSLFILVNDSLPNPTPRFTERRLFRKDSLGIARTHVYNYLSGAPDTLLSVFEGDSVVLTFYGQDQDSLQAGIENSPIAFGMLWNDNLLGVSKGGSTDGISGFSQYLHRPGTIDTLVADTSSTIAGGTATRYRIKLQIPFNLATSAGKADTLVVMISDGTSIVADTLALKVRNTNRPPIWDGDLSSLPSDSVLVFSPNPALAQPDSIQVLLPFTLNNNQTDSTRFSQYVFDPDNPAGDSLGYPLVFAASGNHQGTLDPATGLNVYLPVENDTVTYNFTITASDSYSGGVLATAKAISFRVAPAPAISRIEPAFGAPNDEFVIYGSGFGLFDSDGPDTSRVVFYATTSAGVRQNIQARIISWSREKIVATVPPTVSASRLDVANGFIVPDTIRVISAIYGGFDTSPFTVQVDSGGVEDLEVVNITSSSVTIRYRSSYTGADSIVVASSSDTLDIHEDVFTLPTFVENNNGALSQMRAAVTVYRDQTEPGDGVHLIQIVDDLTPNTLYEFFIGTASGVYLADSSRHINGPFHPKKIDLRQSGGVKPYNGALDAFRFRTLPSGTAGSAWFNVIGTVVNDDGPVEDATVTLRLVPADSPADTSLPITTTSDGAGGWVLNLANLHATDGVEFDHHPGDYLLLGFDGAAKGFEQFDTLRAPENVNNLMRVDTVRLVNYVRYDLELKTGLNLVGVPLNLVKGEPTTATALLNLVQGGRPSITRFVTATGRQETITRTSGGNYIGDQDFPLSISQGYFISVGTRTNLELEGRVYTRRLPVVSLQSGYNFISRPAQSSNLFYSWDAHGLLQDPKINVVIRFDERLQRYDQYFRVGSGYAGTNFGIDPGQGYILDVSSATTWNPNGPGGGTLLASTTGVPGAPDNAIVLDLAGRAAEPAPAQLIVSNLSSASATLAWAAPAGDPGQVRLSLADGTGELVVQPDRAHQAQGLSCAQLTGLKPGARYSYQLENSSGLPLAGAIQGEFTTAQVGAGIEHYALFGRLKGADGGDLAGMVVLLRLRDPKTGAESGYLSALSDPAGYWVLNLANLKDRQSGLPYEWSTGNEVELTILGGAFRTRYSATLQPGSPHNIALDLQGAEVDGGTEQQTGGSLLPKAYALAQNFPNPFNPSTTIAFSIPEGAGETRVRLDIFNLRGQLVRTLADGLLEPGEHRVQWDGIDTGGHRVASGVYFYRLTSREFTATRKMVILK